MYLNSLDLRLKANLPAWYSLPSIMEGTWREGRSVARVFLSCAIRKTKVNKTIITGAKNTVIQPELKVKLM